MSSCLVIMCWKKRRRLEEVCRELRVAVGIRWESRVWGGIEERWEDSGVERVAGKVLRVGHYWADCDQLNSFC
jgi:hypothetical protein